MSSFARFRALPVAFALALALLLGTQPASAAGTSMDVTYHQVVVWTGLSDQAVHSIVVMRNGFANEHSRAPVVMIGPYGIDGSDVQLELTPVEGGWSGDVYDVNGGYLAKVTVSYDSTADAEVSVSAGTLRTEYEYLHPVQNSPPRCRSDYC